MDLHLKLLIRIHPVRHIAKPACHSYSFNMPSCNFNITLNNISLTSSWSQSSNSTAIYFSWKPSFAGSHTCLGLLDPASAQTQPAHPLSLLHIWHTKVYWLEKPLKPSQRASTSHSLPRLLLQSANFRRCQMLAVASKASHLTCSSVNNWRPQIKQRMSVSAEFIDSKLVTYGCLQL